ncbi:MULTISPECIES: flagellar hook-basal body complex protein FliE [Mesorhizobium]|jgi:flagellar hook-basal body complex protein FliE|uniref:Flagellar hook-basal body complex protein FliE n=1 Tax=Mesorhizobium australicum TaxID=536018 RepID=A0A1X7PJV8_9HYPH|nr:MULTISPECIES: flagellar hook-basal body complex protein FliE [Mesorhizobium]MCR5855853.1 flagellar hook-basal body complex protein FliE [Mesorhizobium sp. J428]SMH51965.1 flagellar hook-basal body complex protein FliE [Mesorhizobium australicum]
MIGGISPVGSIGARSLLENLSGAGETATGADFGASLAKALSNAASNTVTTLQSADQVSMKALQGGDVTAREVVDSVMSAERSLQAAIAIRDKIVTAYLEVSRMAI